MNYLIGKTSVFAMAIVSSAYATENISVAQALKALFESADKFENLKISFSSEEKDLIKDFSGARQKNSTIEGWKAYSNNTFLGWILIDEVIGKHEYITFATALTQTGEVAGVEILVYRETHGHEIKRKDWREKFKKKKITDPFKLNVDIPNISGATLSSRNLTDGVKRMLAIHKVVLSK